MSLEKSYSDAISLLQTLISTPSFSREEQHTADILYTRLSELGLNPQRNQNNVWAQYGNDPALPTVLLNSHHDTVKPVAGWKKDPFNPLVEGDVLYGLGSNDAGASLVCLFETFVQLSALNLPYNLVFLASAEEEISGKNGVEEALKHLPAFNFAVVGEPTEMQPAVAEKGLMVLDVTIHGKSGHAARNEGINAIYKSIEEIQKLRNIQFDRKSDWLGDIKISVTQIEAGTQHNVVPDKCSWVVDVRTTDAYSNKEVLERIKSVIDGDVVARSVRLNPSGIDVEHPFVVRAKLLGLKPYGSPTLSDQALMNFPTVKMGPGKSERSHTADEFILLSEIKSAIEIYFKLLKDLTL
ncbi:MAG: M20 family metallo-hydrolase [Cyclobacteriaceae bacterium]|nr:M20 family metallo-hydrolase [Cyclobacteriaceae bacterium]